MNETDLIVTRKKEIAKDVLVIKKFKQVIIYIYV